MSVRGEPSVRVLCVGGPVDGEWKVVRDRYFVVAEPERDFRLFPAPGKREEPQDIIPKRHMYTVDRLSMFGHTLDVAIHDESLREGKDRNDMLLRAILQRDVAQAMGVGRW